MNHLSSRSLHPLVTRCGGARRRATGGALLLVASALGCNAMLGIEEADLCGGGSCDGGAVLPGSSRPNLPPSRVDAGSRATEPESANGTRLPLAPGGGAAAEGPSDEDIAQDGAGGLGTSSGGDAPLPGQGAGSGASSADDEGGDSDESDDDGEDPEPGPAGGEGNPGSPGNGNPGNGNSNPGNGNPGNGSPPPEPPPPPPSPCDGRADGEAFCAGLTRIACGPGGAVTSALVCPSEPHCVQGAGPACATCLDGEARCEGASLISCNATRTGVVTQDCGAAALCNAAASRCEPATCAPGDVRCSGALLETCNATLTGFEPLADCGAPEACNAEAGSCNVCVPEATRCIDAVTVGECDASGQVEEAVGCGLLEVCDEGECVLGLPGLPGL